VGDSLRRSVEESARREHLVLTRTKGEQDPRVLQRGLVESGDSLIPRQNMAEPFLALLLYFLAFTLCNYFELLRS